MHKWAHKKPWNSSEFFCIDAKLMLKRYYIIVLAFFVVSAYHESSCFGRAGKELEHLNFKRGYGDLKLGMKTKDLSKKAPAIVIEPVNDIGEEHISFTAADLQKLNIDLDCVDVFSVQDIVYYIHVCIEGQIANSYEDVLQKLTRKYGTPIQAGNAYPSVKFVQWDDGATIYGIYFSTKKNKIISEFIKDKKLLRGKPQ